ncbi:hypothetical protein FG384_16735 [Psychrobacillus vulpis]|uniref:Uncharacterized protein n=1 Tax=Psychrobacillus vulpis TaxID=2325572 RepID=A0A544TKP3_9BACI|nr:hypothetical protein FG384_16735 [Psychrobacillus vulpis]
MASLSAGVASASSYASLRVGSSTNAVPAGVSPFSTIFYKRVQLFSNSQFSLIKRKKAYFDMVKGPL